MPRTGTVPYVRQGYDAGPGTRRLSDLIRYQGDIEADSAMRQADISARMWAGLGDTIGRTVGDLVRYKGEEPQRRMEATKAAAAERELRNDEDIRGTLQKLRDPVTGRVDEEAAAKEIAGIDPERAQQWWKMADEKKRAELVLEKDRFNQVSQTAGAILAASPEQRSTLYGQARTGLIRRGLLTPEQVPETYNEDWLKAKHLEVLDVAGQVNEFHRRATETNQVARDAETARHNLAMEGKEPTRSASDYRDALDRYAIGLGKPDGSQLTSAEELTFRDQWFDASRRPLAAASNSVRPRVGSDYARALERGARERGKTLDDLTSDEELEISREFYGARRAPAKATTDVVPGDIRLPPPTSVRPVVPAPAPPPSSGARTVTEQDVRAAAGRMGVSYEEAVQRARAEGFTIIR